MQKHNFTISGSSQDVVRRTSNMIARQMPYAMMLSVNDTASFLVRINKKHMQRTFDNANAYTLNAFFHTRATKKNPIAIVQRKEKPSGRHYLEVQESGGQRPQKAVEKLIDMRVPYPGIVRAVLPTSRTGGKANNILMSQVNKVIGGFGSGSAPVAFTRSKKGASASKAIRYFTAEGGRGGSKTGGIYRVTGNGKPQKLFHILDYLPIYRKKYDFQPLMRKFAGKHFDLMIKKNIAKAMRTAKLR